MYIDLNGAETILPVTSAPVFTPCTTLGATTSAHRTIALPPFVIISPAGFTRGTGASCDKLAIHSIASQVSGLRSLNH